MNVLKYVTAFVAFTALATHAVLADPTADITAAYAKFLAAKSFRITTVDPGGRSMTMDVVNPDRKRLTQGPLSLIIIGDTTYMKMGGAPWQKQPPSPANDPAFLKTLTTMPSTAVVRDLGMKTFAGVSLHGYSVQKTPDTPTATVYLDANGMPARVENTDSRGLSVSRIYDIDAPISIEAPI